MVDTPVKKDAYLTCDQCADFLGRSPGAIRNLVMRRKIPFRKPGGRLIFIRSEIIQWIEQAPGITPEEIAANSQD